MESFNGSSSSNSVDEKPVDFIFMVAKATFVTLVALTGIVGNITNTIVIPRVPDTTLGPASKIVLTALAIADLIGAIMLLNGPLSIFTYEWLSKDGNIYCDITGFITTLAPATSASFLFLINLDRYIQITRPLTYQVLVTRRRAIVAVAIAAFYILIFLSFFVGIADDSIDHIAYHLGFSLCLVSFSAPEFLPSTIGSFAVSVWLIAFLLLVMYARIFQIAIRHSEKISAQMNSTARLRDVLTTQGNDVVDHVDGLEHGVSRMGDVINQLDVNLNSLACRKRDNVRKARRNHEGIQRNIRSMCIPLIITGCFLVSWLPLTVLFTFASATGATFGDTTWWTSAVLAASNCSINMFVYAFGRSEYRKAFRKVFCKTFVK
ncbi:alpha-1A adrenergic receptor-like [Lytechinus variegatus]|uniref:alpha-1A adrenergic receptor-like n=1 Tax=Lytechinus variegatus TaxID=7654 RepID=UPI001BB0E42E|nr:alpha-1A adrenergic receptor-like [Lytechinus variegatus]